MKSTSLFVIVITAYLFSYNTSRAQIWINSGAHAYLNTPTYTSVGIGTNLASLIYPFRCVGQGRFCANTGISSPFVEFTFPLSSPTSLDMGSYTTQNQIDFKGSAHITADFYGRMKYLDGTGFAFQTGGVATDRLVITDAGTVGVGITPALFMQLHVEGLASKFSSGTGYVGFTHASGSITLGANTGSPQISFITPSYLPSTVRGKISYTDVTGFDFLTGAAANPSMRIKDDGKVIIGNPSIVETVTPSTLNNYKLFVKDGIITERLKIALYNDGTNWSDYVFAPDYQLLSLDSVKLFTEQNCHLPGMPSADEVYKEGIDVANMDALLLKQIEELWLQLFLLKQENEQLKQLLAK